MQNITITIPAIQGVQGGQRFYQAVVDIATAVNLFKADFEDLPPDQRSQRMLDRKHSGKIRDYVLERKDSYVLPSITVSLDMETVEFVPITEGSTIGELVLPFNSLNLFVINDGQHRMDGLSQALKEWSELGFEHISVQIYLDPRLKRSQQIFADINRTAKNTPSSLNILFDHHSAAASAARSVVNKVSVFSRFTEKEKSSVSGKSAKLFPLRVIHDANIHVMNALGLGYTKNLKIATAYWNAIAENMAPWQSCLNGAVTPVEIRQETIASHNITIDALGRFGAVFCPTYEKRAVEEMNESLQFLRKINWRKDNPDFLENTISEDGRVISRNSAKDFLKEYLLKRR